MALQKHKLRAKGMLRPYGGTGNDPWDKYTVTQISSAAISSIALPASKFFLKKETFFIGGAEREFLIDVSCVA